MSIQLPNMQTFLKSSHWQIVGGGGGGQKGHVPPLPPANRFWPYYIYCFYAFVNGCAPPPPAPVRKVMTFSLIWFVFFCNNKGALSSPPPPPYKIPGSAPGSHRNWCYTSTERPTNWGKTTLNYSPSIVKWEYVSGLKSYTGNNFKRN